MTRIKICGITNNRDAHEASRLGADMLGFVFYKSSPRYITCGCAKEIEQGLSGDIVKVGVFVDESPDALLGIAQSVGLDMAQLHGEETVEYCGNIKKHLKVIKAFRIKDRKGLSRINDYDADFYLLDTYRSRLRGGTGKVFDWGLVSGFEFLRPVILSGGLNSENVLKAIKTVSPYGVDVSSGVEKRPGEKDLELMRGFIETVRKADLHAITG